jgi:DnaK suppressor protein
MARQTEISQEVKSAGETMDGSRVSVVSEGLIQECKTRLLQAKADLMTRARAQQAEFVHFDRGGDEADQSMSLLAENEFLSKQERIKHQLLEIELALARIQEGRFGICEETEEPIEVERLRAIPWTRVSIEGAEIREALQKRFAR